MDEQNCIGRLAYATAGRDEDRYFIVVGIINEEYVYISDGRLRSIEKPKKKKVKHLKLTDLEAEDIKEMILTGKQVSNSEIRKYLQSMNFDKEV